MAMANPLITADMIEASTFPFLANRFQVSGVPQIVINDTTAFVGAQPVESWLDWIEKN